MVKKASFELSQHPSKVNNTVIKIGSPQYMKYITRRDLSGGINCGILDIPPQEAFKVDFKTQNSPLEFIFCFCGSSVTTFKKNGRLYEFGLSQGECGIVHVPNCSGTTAINKKTGYKIINAFIDPEYFGSLADGNPRFTELLNSITEISTNKLFLWKTLQTKKIISCLKELESINSASFSPKVWEISKLYEIIMLIFTEFAEHDKADCKKNLNKHEINTLISVGNILKGNLSAPPPLASLAKSSGLNQTKLQQGFKELFGTTIGGFITERRMEKAKSMLESGSFSVSDAAWELGYTNVSHFINLFRKSFGMTPGQFLSEKRKVLTESLLSSVRRDTE